MKAFCNTVAINVNQRGYSAGKRVRVDQHRNLLFRQMQGAPDGTAIALAYVTRAC
jgi:hypothetical protein